MRSRIQFLTATLFVGGALLVAPRPAAATAITYTETIEDLNHATFLDLFDDSRDLTRTRTFGDGTMSVETNDATIISQNAISDGWGTSTFLPFAWTHVFAPALPVNSFLHAKLTLDVIGVESDLPDLIFLDWLPLGVLNAGGIDVQSTTSLSTGGFADPNSLISFFLADGKLDVMILPLFLDFMSIRSSTLEVTYDADVITSTAVPEPAAAVLLLTGLALVGGWRRYQRSQLG